MSFLMPSTLFNFSENERYQKKIFYETFLEKFFLKNDFSLVKAGFFESQKNIFGCLWYCEIKEKFLIYILEHIH